MTPSSRSRSAVFADDVADDLALTAVADDDGAPVIPRVLQWCLDLWHRGLVSAAPVWLVHDLGLLLLHGAGTRLVSDHRPSPKTRAANASWANHGRVDDVDDVDDHHDAQKGDHEARQNDDHHDDDDDDDHVSTILRRSRLHWIEGILAPALGNRNTLEAHVIIAGASVEQQDVLIPHAIALLLPSLSATKDDARLRGSPAGPNDDDSDDSDDDDDVDGDDDGEFAGDGVSASDPTLGDGARVSLLRALLQHRSPTGYLTLPRGRRPRQAHLAAQRSRRQRRWSPPSFSAEDLWELTHLLDVPAEASRLALRTILRTTAALPPPPLSLLSALRDARADVQLDDDVDDERYPAGGFDAMSTQGTMENLVRSEVAYVGVGADDDPGAPDLFDVRFVEGELLYYTRDESPLMERRRQLQVEVHDVDRLRHKLVGLPTQTLVLVEAVVLRAFRDLQGALSAQAVHLHWRLLGEDDVVDEEEGLLRTLLAADIAHQRARIVGSHAGADDDSHQPSARNLVVFSPVPPPEGSASKKGTRRRQRLWIRVGGTTWSVHGDESLTEVDPHDLRPLVDVLMARS